MPDIGGGAFSLVGKWCFGQGFMDLIHAFASYHKNNDLYTKLCACFNEVQKVLDENGLSDFLLLVFRKE